MVTRELDGGEQKYAAFKEAIERKLNDTDAEMLRTLQTLKR